jgi:hypothetical protein
MTDGDDTSPISFATLWALKVLKVVPAYVFGDNALYEPDHGSGIDRLGNKQVVKLARTIIW